MGPMPSTEYKPKGDWKAASPWANVDVGDAPSVDAGPVLKGTPGENGVPEPPLVPFAGMRLGARAGPMPSTEYKPKGDWKAASPWANVDVGDAPSADAGPVLKGTPGENGVPELPLVPFAGMRLGAR